MVCEDCQKKLGRVITPDVWKAGARNTLESGGRRIGENKLLGSKRFDPGRGGNAKCTVCFQNALNQDALFCQPCAYSKGVCAMCGVKVLDTSGYRMSDSGVKRLGGGEKKAPEAANPAPAAVAGRTAEDLGWKMVLEKGYLYSALTGWCYHPTAKKYWHRERTKGRWLKKAPEGARVTFL